MSMIGNLSLAILHGNMHEYQPKLTAKQAQCYYRSYCLAVYADVWLMAREMKIRADVGIGVAWEGLTSFRPIQGLEDAHQH